MARKKKSPDNDWRKLPPVAIPIDTGMVSSLARGLLSELNEKIAAIRTQRGRGRREEKWVPLLELLQDMEERVEGALTQFNAGVEEHDLESVEP